MQDWWNATWPVLTAVLGGLLLLWLVLLVVLWNAYPEQTRLRDALRLLPDVIRLVKRLAGDRSLPRGVRVRLLLLLAYLASPVDLVPDFIPVLGYADDAIVVVLVLRSVARSAGTQALDRHWPGTPDGLARSAPTCGRQPQLPAPVTVADRIKPVVVERARTVTPRG